jgi:hypothetical protein
MSGIGTVRLSRRQEKRCHANVRECHQWWCSKCYGVAGNEEEHETNDHASMVYASGVTASATPGLSLPGRSKKEKFGAEWHDAHSSPGREGCAERSEAIPYGRARLSLSAHKGKSPCSGLVHTALRFLARVRHGTLPGLASGCHWRDGTYA